MKPNLTPRDLGFTSSRDSHPWNAARDSFSSESCHKRGRLLQHRIPWLGLRLSLWSLGWLAESFLAQANPEGMQVVSGSAHATQTGSQLNIVVSQNTFLNWSRFNIGRGETTVFQQPSASSIVWNRINDPNPSQIFGNLHANGMVVLANQSGFYFGPNAFVKAAGLYVTTAPISPSLNAPGSFTFDDPPPSIPIVNYGRLETLAGGSLFLIAKKVENHGSLSAPEGTVGLVAGDSLMISDRPDGRGLSVQVKLPAGSVDNVGQITADAGQVLLQARTVNQGGAIHADSVREAAGVIEIFASDTVALSSASSITARGDSGVASSGGRITIKSDHLYKDETGSFISASGGDSGGHGGQVELSAPLMNQLRSHLDASAQRGWRSGGLLLDPTDINLSAEGSDLVSGDTVNANDPPGTLNLNVNTAFAGFSSITLEATHAITLKAGTDWRLDVSTGKDEPSSRLTLRAGADIKLESGSAIRGGENWSLSLTAGANFSGAQEPLRGVGNLTMAGNALIETAKGSVSVLAGNGVTVGSGAIRTVQGGGIDVNALAGTVNTGSNPSGFDFSQNGVGYSASANLGGISTRAGGDVSITAGKDVVAFLPPASGIGVNSEAGAGTFGAEPGNLIIEAGGNVTGHYVVRNGNGLIHAKGNAGTSSKQFALSLVKGAWSVNAEGSISLQEVRNPNGVFNQPSVLTAPINFHFDYDPGSSVSLKAANQVTLTGSSLARSTRGQGIPVIYPPSLSIEAGSGGIVLGSDITLFPSASGNLSLKTTGAGDFVSSNPSLLRRLVLSDSDKREWRDAVDFTSSDSGNNMLHLSDSRAASLDIAGSVSGVQLQLAKAVRMEVGGDILNSSVKLKNLRDSDESLISAGGRIKYRTFYTFVTLTDDQAAPSLEEVLPYASLGAQFTGRLVYNPTTKRLGFAGVMQPEERDSLKSIEIPDPNDPTGVGRISVSLVDPAVIDRLYRDSQDVPVVPVPGIAVSGPGALKIRASSMDLGLSDGIQSLGIVRAAQVPYTTRGADIDIALSGNFDMLSSTVLSRYGGHIHLTSGGVINVGSQELLSDSGLPRGIVSLWGGNIEVIAHGNVEVNGSRIATYDGGNIHVISETGNVDAGKGGTGFVVVEKPYVDPRNGEVAFARTTIPGSGILTTSYPLNVPGQPSPQLGNIAVETPMGDILAGAGGFVQLDLSGNANTDASVVLNAGTRNPDGSILHRGSILANGSGVIGNRVDLKATGDITGLVVAQGNLSIRAEQNVNVTVIGQGGVNVSSSAGSVSGTIVGVGAVNVSGISINANVVAGPGQANVSGAVSGNGSQAAAPVASTASQADSKKADELVANGGGTKEEDPEKKRDKPLLAKRRVSRVTVILPNS